MLYVCIGKGTIAKKLVKFHIFSFKVEITPSNVPFPQCREIRTEGVGESKRLDNIIIPASTAIVVCVIVAVIIFIACLKVLKSNHQF